VAGVDHYIMLTVGAITFIDGSFLRTYKINTAQPNRHVNNSTSYWNFRMKQAEMKYIVQVKCAHERRRQVSGTSIHASKKDRKRPYPISFLENSKHSPAER